MANIKIGGGYARVDDADVALARQHNWTVHERHGTTYAVTTTRDQDGRRRQLRMHRLLVGAKRGQIVDHINHNGLDNRRKNLRIVDPVKSNWNRRCRSVLQSSAYKGVSKERQSGRWKACIRHEVRGTVLTIGRFDDEEQAAQAYDLFATRYWKEDELVLNFPNRKRAYMDLIECMGGSPDVRTLRKFVRGDTSVLRTNDRKAG